MLETLAFIAFSLALVPALVFLFNLPEFRRPRFRGPSVPRPPVSVLIPARNEERNIATVLDSVLSSDGVELEVIVLDDHSTDRTPAIVREHTKRDSRVRLETAPPLPEGWAGKQHACAHLATHAGHEILFFLDADVRLTPHAIAAMVDFLEESEASLVSGFPGQELKTLGEKLLIPMIHFILLGFLSIRMMRLTNSPGCGAGWGGLFVTRKDEYDAVGGHSAIRNTFHDGIRLPRLYRRHGKQTDFCNLAWSVTCRMYQSSREVWNGLGKNATEGIASPQLIVPFSVLLFGGQILPWILLPFSPGWAGAAIALGVGTRLLQAFLYRLSIIGALLQPVSVTLFLCIQWQALSRKMRGLRPSWRDRTLDDSFPG